MEKTKVLWVFFLFITISTYYLTTPVLADGPYKGKVIDAETKRPIEGAVVVIFWTRRIFWLTHTSTYFVDVKETLTDKNGEFELPGIRKGDVGKSRFGIQEPNIRIFKPRYGNYPWRHKKSEGNLSSHFSPYSLVELPPLRTREERVDNIDSSTLSSLVPRHKVTKWWEIRNEERISLGFEPTR